MATEAQPALRAALVAGASGLTGQHLLRQLLRVSDHARIHAVTRRPLLIDHPRLANRILRLEQIGPRLVGLRCDEAFCCLGAAGGPRAPAEELRGVDVDLVLTIARAALSAGAMKFVVVSAAGADPQAAGAFLRAKGEMESALRVMKFAAVHFLQPGAVCGPRAGDGIADLARTVLRPLANGLLQGRYAARRAISGEDLAAAMLGAARSQRRGVSVWAGETLRDLAVAGRRPS